MPYEWMNDRDGKPLAAWVPGKGWVAGQNWSHWDGEGEKAIGSRSNLIEQTNDYYKTGRDAQIANTGGYVLGSVGGSSDPYSRTFDPTGVDTTGLTDLQRQMFDPTSTWGNAGYNSWGSGTDPNVGRPSAEYRKIPFAKNETENFFTNTAKTAFGFDEGGGGVGAGTILAAWLAAGAAAGAGSAGAGGADAATAAGAMGGAEGAAAGAGGGYGATGGNWWDNLFSTSTETPWGVNPQTQATGGGMPDFSGGDFDWSSFGELGGGGDINLGGGSDVFRDVGTQPAPTNLQDMMTKLDSTSQGRALLNQLTGGSSDGVNSLLSQLTQKFGEQGAKSALAKLLSGDASAADYASILGRLGATGLGIYGANQQANSMNPLAQRYEGYGAPYRAMLEQSYKDPNAFLANSPDIQASVNQGTNALARSLSRQDNPTGSGAALHELQNYATQGLYGQLGNERNRLANFGGMSNFNAAAPGLAGQAIGAQGGALNALGSGISSITNPPTTLEQALNALNGMSGLKLNSGMGI